MKTTKLKTIIITAMVLTAGVFTSCETEDVLLNENNDISLDETTSIKEVENTASSRTYYSRVSRYFLGGANSIHTYTVGFVGNRLGSRESTPFQLGLYEKLVTPTPPAGTRQLFFLRSPGSRDFLLTTNTGERSRLLGSGWRDFSEYREIEGSEVLDIQASFIHTSGGGGRVQLHRFYGVANTDHLFTINYQEGINAGYRYEGVTGWVYR